MYISLEKRILEITGGKCPYKNRVCDGLCNNCGILASPTPQNKIVKCKNSFNYSYDDLNALEDRCINNEE